MTDRKTDGRSGDKLAHSPELHELLKAAAHRRESVPWHSIERLVAEAPPVRVPWYEPLLRAGARPLRYGMSLMLVLLLGTGLLAMMPAQSDQVGTMILTKLPSAWHTNNAVFAEAKAFANAELVSMDIPESDLFVILGERDGRDELAFVLMGVDATAADGFFNAITDAYPALDAFAATMEPLNTGRFGSRLNELAFQFTHSGAGTMDDTELKGYVLKALAETGIRNVENIAIEHRADGKIVITIDAAFELAVGQAYTQEELAAAGLSKELLGESEFQALIDCLAIP